MVMIRSRHQAVTVRHRILRRAGFAPDKRHRIWVNAATQKIISEHVVWAINVAQLRCWIGRPVRDGEWSTWFKRPLRKGVLGNLTYDYERVRRADDSDPVVTGE